MAKPEKQPELETPHGPTAASSPDGPEISAVRLTKDYSGRMTYPTSAQLEIRPGTHGAVAGYYFVAKSRAGGIEAVEFVPESNVDRVIFAVPGGRARRAGARGR